MANYERYKDGKEYTEFGFWLVFTNNASAPKAFSREPRLKASERAMFMMVTLPVSLWATPSLKATITVPDMSVQPIEIDTEAAASALKAVLGFEVELSVQRPEEL